VCVSVCVSVCVRVCVCVLAVIRHIGTVRSHMSSLKPQSGFLWENTYIEGGGWYHLEGGGVEHHLEGHLTIYISSSVH